MVWPLFTTWHQVSGGHHQVCTRLAATLTQYCCCTWPKIQTIISDLNVFFPIYVLASIVTLLMRLQPTRVNYNVVIKGKLRSIEDRRKYTKHSNSFSNSVVVIQVHFPKEDRRLPSSLYYCYLGVCFSNNLWHVRLMWLVILRFWQQNRQTSTWVILEFFSRL